MAIGPSTSMPGSPRPSARADSPPAPRPRGGHVPQLGRHRRAGEVLQAARRPSRARSSSRGASAPVRTVLDMTRLTALLVDDRRRRRRSRSPSASTLVAPRPASARSSTSAVRTPGAARRSAATHPLGSPADRQAGARHCACPPSTTAIGDWRRSARRTRTARDRLGEFARGVPAPPAYLPADGTEVPDYLFASGARGAGHPRCRAGSRATGAFARHLRFEAHRAGRHRSRCRRSRRWPSSWPATRSACVVVVAETAGLVGAALRQSPRRPGRRLLRVSRRAHAAHVHRRARVRRRRWRSSPASCSAPGGPLPAAQLRPLDRDSGARWGTSTPPRSRSGRSRRDASSCSDTVRDALRRAAPCRACCTC